MSFNNLINITPIKDWVFIEIVDKGERKTKAGIIIPDDDFKESGMRPRICKVLAVNQNSIDCGLTPGDHVIIPHGEWTRKLGKAENVDGSGETDFWAVLNTKIEMIIEDPYDRIVGR